MRSIDWDRWAPASGIVFVVLIVITFFLPPSAVPAIGASASEVAAWLTDHRSAVLANVFVSGLALVFFVWFLGSLATRLRDAGERRLGIVALGGGLLLAAYALAEISGRAALAHTLAAEGDAGVVQAIFVVSYYGPGGAFALAVLLGAAGAAALKSGALPRWLGAASVVIALWALVAAASLAQSGFFALGGPTIWIAFIAFFAWMLVVSVVLVRSTPATEPAARPAAAQM